MTTDNNGYDQAPSVDEPIEQSPPPQSNGARHNQNIPGSEGFYVSGGGGGGQAYNAAEEIMSFPADDPGRYLPRAIIDDKYLRRQVAMRSRVARMYTGFEDPLFSYWFYLAGTPAINGVARKQFVIISTGDRQVEIANKSGGFFGAMGQRILGNENNNLSK